MNHADNTNTNTDNNRVLFIHITDPNPSGPRRDPEQAQDCCGARAGRGPAFPPQGRSAGPPLVPLRPRRDPRSCGPPSRLFAPACATTTCAAGSLAPPARVLARRGVRLPKTRRSALAGRPTFPRATLKGPRGPGGGGPEEGGPAAEGLPELSNCLARVCCYVGTSVFSAPPNL